LSRPNFSATLKIVEKSGIYNTSFLCSLNAKVLNTGPGFVGRYRLAKYWRMLNIVQPKTAIRRHRGDFQLIDAGGMPKSLADIRQLVVEIRTAVGSASDRQ
jgi:hypothetical protein